METGNSDTITAGFDKLFANLRGKRYAFYAPERILRAHRDGLFRGWGMRATKMEPVLELLCSQAVPFRLPIKKSGSPTWEEEHLLAEFGDFLIPHSGNTDCPPLPKEDVVSDALWEALVSHFDMSKSRSNRLLSWDGWVYSVRFFPFWLTHREGSLDLHRPRKGTPAEIKEWRRNAAQVRAKRKSLRNDYGINGQYARTRRNAILLVVKKAYPPEQVRRNRHQLVDLIRKSPAEVIRLALRAGLME